VVRGHLWDKEKVALKIGDLLKEFSFYEQEKGDLLIKVIA
jgi:hypothetical protein